ncbi:nitroreductase family protein [Algoriphagus hitonicola]|uniref:Nitroreductase n=1 Tax=Algoriphagus hitonicola TaxID=435880 RepID=A0A1I2S0R1_9BACT|nr:nitroreductase family protein [Algoriphagus hitonicola]SFG46320.1 Nitroreductase [Algoriphagus hitonicola]
MKRKLIQGYPYISYSRPQISGDESIEKSNDFYHDLSHRRTVREFSTRPIPEEVITNLIKTAGSAPSGANKQPWTFCVVTNPLIKKQIRIAAEAEEKVNYASRMSSTWIQDLKHLGTDWEKPFLEEAPALLVVFKQSYGIKDGQKIQHYYVSESVGIACGFLIAAIHQAGLVTVTHTPSPMNFLASILDRPDFEKPFLLLPIGFAKEETLVPDIVKKPLEDILVHY